MLFFKLEAQKSRDFDKGALVLFDQMIEETSEQLKKMDNLEVVTEKSILNIVNSD